MFSNLSSYRKRRTIKPTGVTIPDHTTTGFLPVLSMNRVKRMLPMEKLMKLIEPMKPMIYGGLHIKPKFSFVIQL
jgi:hypothetical protein